MKALLRRAALAVALPGLLAGCKLQWAYEYADWLVLYAVKGNFELDDPQLQGLKKDVDAYFRWHRREMLPHYSGFLLRSLDTAKLRGLEPAHFDSGYREFRELRRLTMAPVVDRAAALLISLRPEQVDAYEARLRKKNEKLRRDLVGTPDYQRARRYKKILEGIEDWVGRLDAEQKRRLQALCQDLLPWDAAPWLANRESVQARMFGLLRDEPDPGRLREFLSQYFQDPDALAGPAYLKRRRITDEGVKKLTVEMFAMLTPRQKKHLFAKVEKLARSFERLHAASGPI